MCGFLKTMKKLLQKDWDKFFKLGNQCLSVKKYEKNLLDNLPIGAKILDFGCGDASLGIEVSKRNLNYIGIDYSAQALIRAAAKLKPYPNAKLIQADINEMPIDKKMNADLIVIRSVLAHINDKKGLFDTAKKLLKPGGKIFILSPIRPDSLIVNKDLKMISLVEGDIDLLCREVGLSLEIIAEEHFPSEQAFMGAYICY